MAQTWRALVQGVTFAVNRNMISLLNAGTNVLRVTRVGFVGTQTAAVGGVVAYGEIRRYAGASISGETPLTPVAYDSTNTALSSVSASTLGTPDGSSYEVLCSYVWSTDEAAVSGATIDELQTFTFFGTQLDYGYGDDNVQPIVLREDEMIAVYNLSGAVGTADMWIEFTNEAT